MARESNSESMSFNPFSKNNNLSDNNQDPDVRFFLDNIPSLNTEHFSPFDVKVSHSSNPLTHFSTTSQNLEVLGKTLKMSRNFVRRLI